MQFKIEQVCFIIILGIVIGFVYRVEPAPDVIGIIEFLKRACV
jgi:hypothetical protein